MWPSTMNYFHCGGSINSGKIFNASRPSDVYMSQYAWPSLFQMSWRLFDAKPYCYLDPWKLSQVKFESIYSNFHSCKSFWKCLQNGSHSLGGCVLMKWSTKLISIVNIISLIRILASDSNVHYSQYIMIWMPLSTYPTVLFSPLYGWCLDRMY